MYVLRLHEIKVQCTRALVEKSMQGDGEARPGQACSPCTCIWQEACSQAQAWVTACYSKHTSGQGRAPSLHAPDIQPVKPQMGLLKEQVLP